MGKNRVRMPGTSGDELPTDPPPDYDYAVNHPAEQVSLPEYRVAVKLPSYQQAVLDKEKLLEDVDDDEIDSEPTPIHHHRRVHNAERGEFDESDQDIALLGTDLAFVSAFLTSFLFNWVGFLLLMCFCHTIASRYGALAGSGFWIPDLCESLFSVSTNQEILETPFLICKRKIVLLLLIMEPETQKNQRLKDGRIIIQFLHYFCSAHLNLVMQIHSCNVKYK